MYIYVSIVIYACIMFVSVFLSYITFAYKYIHYIHIYMCTHICAHIYMYIFLYMHKYV